MNKQYPPTVNRIALSVAMIYAAFGMTWILFSDQVLALLVSDANTITTIQSVKGVLYILVTALLVFVLVRTFVGRASAAKRLLDASSELYRDVVERTNDLVTQVDAQGNFTYVNQRARDIFGLGPKQCIGRSAFDFIHPEDREKTVQRFNAALKDRVENVEFENRQLGPEGKLTWMLWSSNIHYHQDGSVATINGIGHNITRRKQLEEVLVQTEKMISIGGLAAGMAHEINNPLAGILQSAQVLGNRLSADLPRNQRLAEEVGIEMGRIQDYLMRLETPRLIESIRQDGGRVARIVSDLLEFGRSHEAPHGPVDLAELLEQTISLAAKEFDLGQRLDFRSIRIDRNFPPLPVHALGDRSQLQQVFLNLLRNGAQAMLRQPGGGTAPLFEVSLKETREWQEITIADNGCGMDEEVRRRIFEPFYTTKDVGQGTGLGLFVAYYIVVEKHDGQIEVSSSPGAGSRFIVRLPKATGVGPDLTD